MKRWLANRLSELADKFEDWSRSLKSRALNLKRSKKESIMNYDEFITVMKRMQPKMKENLEKKRY